MKTWYGFKFSILLAAGSLAVAASGGAPARVSYRRQDDKGGLGPAIETTLSGQTC